MPVRATRAGWRVRSGGGAEARHAQADDQELRSGASNQRFFVVAVGFTQLTDHVEHGLGDEGRQHPSVVDGPVPDEVEGGQVHRQLVGEQLQLAAIALADIDADGDVEILAYKSLLDHNGNLLWEPPLTIFPSRALTSADLDNDGDQEIIFGNIAYHHNGVPYYNQYDEVDFAYPQVGNLDSDPEPEILLTGGQGLALLEHDGQIVFNELRPTGDLAGTWRRPSAILNLDSDSAPEFASASRNNFATYESDATLRWMGTILDASGNASGTGFDLLGDGRADAFIADETFMHVFDHSGATLFSIPRSSRTGIEYPVVADVDNDNSAEIVITSSDYISGEDSGIPTVQVVHDAQDRWVPTRRIWNQHTYHVTNVREDSTIPQHEKPSWQVVNTFRAQAQFESNGVCEPEL